MKKCLNTRLGGDRERNRKSSFKVYLYRLVVDLVKFCDSFLDNEKPAMDKRYHPLKTSVYLPRVCAKLLLSRILFLLHPKYANYL